MHLRKVAKVGTSSVPRVLQRHNEECGLKSVVDHGRRSTSHTRAGTPGVDGATSLFTTCGGTSARSTLAWTTTNRVASTRWQSLTTLHRGIRRRQCMTTQMTRALILMTRCPLPLPTSSARCRHGYLLAL